jgi:hypothetical protein
MSETSLATEGGASGSEGVDASSVSSTTSGGSASESSSDGMAIDCESLADEKACLANEGPYLCQWHPVWTVERLGDACDDVGPTFMCLRFTGFSGGCVPPPECSAQDKNPYYRLLPDGKVLMGSICLDDPPVGFEFCESGLAANAQPPECACWCELADAGGTGSSSSSGG